MKRRTMQVRRLIKSSNESLGPICLCKLSFGIFRVPQLRYQLGDSTLKSLHLRGLKGRKLRHYCIHEIQKPNECISNVWPKMADKYAPAMIKSWVWPV